MTKDPVCGMDVNEYETKHSTTWEGQKYHFCSDQCKQEFEREPRQYAGRQSMGQMGQQGMGQGRQEGQHEQGQRQQPGRAGGQHKPEKKYGT